MKLTSVQSTAIRIKEAIFLAEVTKHKEYERSKDIKWFKCLGSLPLDEKEATEIFAKREQENKNSVSISSHIVHSKVNFSISKIEEIGDSIASRTDKPLLYLFKEAGWKVITRNRLSIRLQKLKKFTQNHGKSKQEINKLIESNSITVEDDPKDIQYFAFREEFLKSEIVPNIDEDAFESVPEVLNTVLPQIESFPSFTTREHEEAENKGYKKLLDNVQMSIKGYLNGIVSVPNVKVVNL